MTDQENPEQEPGFDDPAYADLRALLADARTTEPLPDHVAVRLEETLAELTADRRRPGGETEGENEAAPAPEPAPVPGTVVPLRRRSRVGSRLLAAAAAVVLVGAGGVGISEVLRTSGADQRVADSASAFESDDSESAPAPSAPSAEGLLDRPYDVREEAWGETAAALPTFTSAGFAAEAAAFRLPAALASGFSSTPQSGAPTTVDGVPTTPGPDTDPSGRPESGRTLSDQLSAAERQRLAYTTAKAACPGPVGTGAVLVPIRYDGLPASLVVYRAVTDGRRYEAWSCDGTTLLASTVVPR